MLEWFHLMEKICIKIMGVQHSFEKKNETTTKRKSYRSQA